MAVLLIAAFLYGAGVPMPSVPVVVAIAIIAGLLLRKRRPRYMDED